MNVPVADMNVSALLDDTSAPNDTYDNIDRKYDLTPTATEVMYRSIMRLVLSTLTAAIVLLAISCHETFRINHVGFDCWFRYSHWCIHLDQKHTYPETVVPVHSYCVY